MKKGEGNWFVGKKIDLANLIGSNLFSLIESPIFEMSFYLVLSGFLDQQVHQLESDDPTASI